MAVNTTFTILRDRMNSSDARPPPRLTMSSLLSFATHFDWALNYLRHEKFELANVASRIRRGTDSLTSVIDYVNAQFVSQGGVLFGKLEGRIPAIRELELCLRRSGFATPSAKRPWSHIQ